jgi:chromosome segregation ATPase
MVNPMATPEDIAEHQQESGTRTTHKLGDGIERAMADAEKRISRLLDKLHSAAQGSAAFEGAERDTKRVLEWFKARTHELETELEKLAKDVGSAAHRVTGRKDHKEQPERLSLGEEDEPGPGAPAG